MNGRWFVKPYVMFALCLLAASPKLLAQDVPAQGAASQSAAARPFLMKGRLTDGNKQPIPDATLLVRGTGIGTITDLDGNYSLNLPSGKEGCTLVISCVGYESLTVDVSNLTSFDFTLEEMSQYLESVVVTALGITRAEKALSYNVQQVQGDELLVAKDANFINALNGKIAGVVINSSSSGIGGESKVVMRGTKGISQSSNALYVIDGVPMYSFENHGQISYWSRGRSEAIADFNSEDIESVSVLTGATAAALYGGQAANGAIIITTKSGAADRARVSFSSSTSLGNPFVMPRFQNTYGNEPGMAGSWGSKLPAGNRPGYEPAKDFFQTSLVAMENVSVSAGTDKSQVYASAGAANSKGIVPNNAYNRYNFNLRHTSSLLNDRLHLALSAQYISQNDRNMVNQGIYSNPINAAYLYPRGESWDEARRFEQYDEQRGIMVQNWVWMPQGSIEWDNPYWTANRVIRENNKRRYVIGASVSYDVADWLKLSGRLHLDDAFNTYTAKVGATTNTVMTNGSLNGYYEVEDTKENQLYADFMASINKRFSDKFSLNANIGASLSDVKSDLFANRGPIRDDGLPNVFNVFQLNKQAMERVQEGWHEQTQSAFASVELGYNNAYFLTLTGRQDWPSQLAGPHSSATSFFYPSAGLSVLLSEVLNLPRAVDFLKLRGSWASVGLPFPRFLANPSYVWNNKTEAWEISRNYPIYDLKPERTNSWEIGLSARFLKHFSLDVSYYNARSFNQTFDSQLSVSSGYSKLYVQTGDVLNHGVELSLGYNNTWGKFSWDSHFTMSANRNKVKKLMEGYVHPQTGASVTLTELKVGDYETVGMNSIVFALRPGGTLGDLYSVVDLKRDDAGKVIVSDNGEVSRETPAELIKLGTVLPKANMAFSNEFGYGRFRFGMMFSARIGGVVYSPTQARIDNAGVSEDTAIARDRGGVMVDGKTVSAQNWYTVIGANNGVPQYYTYSATNVRLAEASVGYTFPMSFISDHATLDASLVGKNLLMLHCKAPFDPESVATSANYYQGIDYFMVPSLRSFALNLRLNF